MIIRMHAADRVVLLPSEVKVNSKQQCCQSSWLEVTACQKISALLTHRLYILTVIYLHIVKLHFV